MQQTSPMQTTDIEYIQAATEDGQHIYMSPMEMEHKMGMSKNSETHTVHNQETEEDTKKLSSWMGSNTRSVLVVCLIVIAVIVITVLLTLHVKETSDGRNAPMIGPSDFPDNYDFIAFDISSMHATIFASSNGKMMSNKFFDGCIAGPGKRQLLRYEGVIGDRSVLEGEQIDIHFKVKYEVIKKATSDILIFDFAICTLCNIDKRSYGGSSCLDMHAAVHHKINAVKLSFQENGKYTSNKIFESLANIGTINYLSFNAHVNSLTKSISYNDQLGKHLNTFSNVNFTEPLYILFGLYNAEYFKSSIYFV